MRRQVDRAWLFALILVIVLAFALLLGGCYSESNANESFETVAPQEKTNSRTEQARAREKYAFDMVYFDWRGVYLVKLQGHEYLRAGDFILHTASCPGEHYLIGP